jgi:ATPase subunit of ABC transporter with duplicated ATPase domains
MYLCAYFIIHLFVFQGEIVDVRKEDKTLPKFEFPLQNEFSGRGAPALLLEINGARDPLFKDKFVNFKAGGFSVHKGMHIRIVGPNGIGKSTLLNDLVTGQLQGSFVHKNATIGYYQQDFSSLDFDSTVLDALQESSGEEHSDQELRKIAASFFIVGEMVRQKIGSLSEGQKGLLALTCLVLEKPSILIVDEPTNHINFRFVHFMS